MNRHDAEERIWADIERVSKSFQADRLQLGKLFYQLRSLYSERSNSAARRLSSGHGIFTAEVKKRGYKPNRVQEMLRDYEVSEGLRPPFESTAAKRKARRSNSANADYWRGFHDAGIGSTRAALDNDPLTRFAALLPYAALKAAYRAALQELHPDHGGSTERTQELIQAWKEVERLHDSPDGIAELRVQ